MLAMARRGGRREAAVEVLDAEREPMRWPDDTPAVGSHPEDGSPPSRRRSWVVAGAVECAIVAFVVAANVVGGGDVGRSTAPASTATATVPVIGSTVPAQPATTTPSVTVVAGPPNPPVILASAPAGYRLVEADLRDVGGDQVQPAQLWATNPDDPATSAWVLLTAYAAPTGSASGGSGTGRLHVPVSDGVGLLDVTPGGLSLLDAPIDGGGVQLTASGMDVAAMAAVINDTRLTGQGLAPSVGPRCDRRGFSLIADSGPTTSASTVRRVRSIGFSSADDGWIGVSVGGRASTRWSGLLGHSRSATCRPPSSGAYIRRSPAMFALLDGTRSS